MGDKGVSSHCEASKRGGLEYTALQLHVPQVASILGSGCMHTGADVAWRGWCFEACKAFQFITRRHINVSVWLGARERTPRTQS